MANTVHIALDPENKALTMTVVDADGEVVAELGDVVMVLDDLTAAPEGHREARFRKHRFKNSDDSCNYWAFYYLGTDAQPDP